MVDAYEKLGGEGGEGNLKSEGDGAAGEATANLASVIGMEVEGGLYEGEGEGGGILLYWIIQGY